MAVKMMRLSQVARKLNIGKNTIIHFLESQGYKIQDNPNFKISGEQLELLSKEFTDTELVREEGSRLSIGSKNDEIIIGAKSQELQGIKAFDKIDLSKGESDHVKNKVDKDIKPTGKIDLPIENTIQKEQIISHPKTKSNTNVDKETKDISSISSVPRKSARKVKKKFCFVIMPFRTELKTIFDDIIYPIVKDFGQMECIRVDDIFKPSMEIMKEIYKNIRKSTIMIADLTDKNPNVFYELGYAHAIGKPVILIAQKLDDVPFDLRHRSVITYESEDSYSGRTNLKEKLEKYFKSFNENLNN